MTQVGEPFCQDHGSQAMSNYLSNYWAPVVYQTLGHRLEGLTGAEDALLL
jgi:hypothetical protein